MASKKITERKTVVAREYLRVSKADGETERSTISSCPLHSRRRGAPPARDSLQTTEGHTATPHRVSGIMGA